MLFEGREFLTFFYGDKSSPIAIPNPGIFPYLRAAGLLICERAYHVLLADL